MRILNILFTILVFSLVAIAGIGSYKSQYPKMTTESHIYYSEEVVIEKTPNVIVRVPEVRLATFRSYTEEELYLLSQLAMAEARGEDAVGQALVMRTVLNRCEKNGRTIKENIYASGQFATSTIGRYEPNENNCKAIRMILEGWDESEGCIYFNAEGYSYGEPLFTHGGHYFSK